MKIYKKVVFSDTLYIVYKYTTKESLSTSHEN